ncbi:MAG: hypothetical protein MJA27_28070 [Pseudanabaenales cyanobacterium]|nr:hypothetical protein [Pseudanabaenales cyanobacterium]
MDAEGGIVSTGIEFAPPWVIEILSPDQKIANACEFSKGVKIELGR